MIDKILIHTCCADCLINLIHSLEEEKQISEETNIILFFYNPNIHPRSEYFARLDALKRVLIDKYPNRKIKFVIPEYRPKEYFESIAQESRRCLGCWRVRLLKTFQYAKENDIHYVSSTLLSSHYQDAETILKIGKELGDTDIHAIYPMEAHEQLNNHGFYKQNYCGCCYSLNERMSEKYIK